MSIINRAKHSGGSYHTWRSPGDMGDSGMAYSSAPNSIDEYSDHVVLGESSVEPDILDLLTESNAQADQIGFWSCRDLAEVNPVGAAGVALEDISGNGEPDLVRITGTTEWAILDETAGGGAPAPLALYDNVLGSSKPCAGEEFETTSAMSATCRSGMVLVKSINGGPSGADVMAIWEGHEQVGATTGMIGVFMGVTNWQMMTLTGSGTVKASIAHSSATGWHAIGWRIDATTIYLYVSSVGGSWLDVGSTNASFTSSVHDKFSIGPQPAAKAGANPKMRYNALHLYSTVGTEARLKRLYDAIAVAP